MYNTIALLPFDIERFVSRLPTVLLTLLIGFLAVRLLQWMFCLVMQTAHVTKALQQILLSTISIVLWIGVIALVFQSLGLNQIALALSGSVAIIGFGIAAGAGKLVSDILAGLFLAKNRDFYIGQHIKMGDLEGQIHSLDSRKVRILGQDGALYIIPNTKFDEQTWQIFSDSTNAAIKAAPSKSKSSA
jgi:small-conductance mechanosensitive channel